MAMAATRQSDCLKFRRWREFRAPVAVCRGALLEHSAPGAPQWLQDDVVVLLSAIDAAHPRGGEAGLEGLSRGPYLRRRDLRYLGIV